MKVFLTQSFGRESEYRRAILAILSFWSWYEGDMEVASVLMTDKPEYFEKYLSGVNIQYILLTQEKIKEMRGEINFIHRMKIALIDEVYKIYPYSDLLYVDSDTFFVKEPSGILQSINGEASFMHLQEYTFAEYKEFSASGVGESTHKDLVSLLENRSFSTSIGDIRLDGLATWNAGVLGLSKDKKYIIPDIYNLTDVFYKCAPMNGSEQAAFSFMLQKTSNIYPAEKYVYHYWGVFKKIVIDAILENYINKDLSKLDYISRLNKVKKMTHDIPCAIDINEQTFVYFNSGQFAKGLLYTLKTFRYSFFNTPILRDVLYQFKRRLVG